MGLYSTIPGRLGDIIDFMYSHMDDTKGGTDTTGRFVTPPELLLWIGECYKDIANGGFFKTSTTIDITSGQSEYNLLTLIPRLIKAQRVRKVSSGDWLTALTDRNLLAIARQYAGSLATAKLGYLEGYNLQLIGTPTATEADALEVYYSYYPPYQITLSLVAVVNTGGGIVTVAAPSNELIVGDNVMIAGSTNYSGVKVITAADSAGFSFAATYVAETIGSGVTCFCHPRTPISRDVVYSRYCEMTRALKDSRGVWNKQVDGLNKLFQQAKYALLHDGSVPELISQPERPF